MPERFVEGLNSHLSEAIGAATQGHALTRRTNQTAPSES
jgi:hypothetical protein